MKSDQYVTIVVLPTLHEFMQKPSDRRLAYLSAISTYHVIDYLMRVASPPDRKARHAEIERISEAIRSRCPDAFTVVEGMCNGSKHCGRDTGTPFTPGDERERRRFGFGPGNAGWGEGQWDKPRLVLKVDGKDHYIDAVIRAFLIAAADAFPDDLGHVFPAYPSG